MSIPPLYTIIVSREKFIFTQDQLESDPGNYFLSHFFDQFGEAVQGTREYRVKKEPKLFQLIQAHLRGYDIFPIPDAIVPLYMTKETLVNNLLNEARFYGLGTLCPKMPNYQETQRKKGEPEKEAPIRQRSYKFATYSSGWKLIDMAEGGLDLYMKRSVASSTLFIPDSLGCPGDRILVAWKAGGSSYAILESNS